MEIVFDTLPTSAEISGRFRVRLSFPSRDIAMIYHKSTLTLCSDKMAAYDLCRYS